MVTTADCKEAIVKACKGNRQYLDSQFVEPLTDAEYEATLQVKNWKRMSKRNRSNGPGCIRVFDCRPFDDQLRAIVGDDSASITKVVVQGE